VKLNGELLKSFKITYDEIKNGGKLEFEMTEGEDSGFME
jgi:hypothetical protein